MIPLTLTASPPSDLSSTLANATVLRRYGSAPGLDPVVAEFATFSAITRKRVLCAAMPFAESPIVLLKSMAGIS